MGALAGPGTEEGARGAVPCPGEISGTRRRASSAGAGHSPRPSPGCVPAASPVVPSSAPSASCQACAAPWFPVPAPGLR